MEIGRAGGPGLSPVARPDAAPPVPTVRSDDPSRGKPQKEAEAAGGGSFLSPDEVRRVVDGMNVILEKSGSHLKYTWHEKLGEYYVQIIDDRTNEVIKEIPPKKWLDLVAAMYEQLGWIIDQRI